MIWSTGAELDSLVRFAIRFDRKADAWVSHVSTESYRERSVAMTELARFCEELAVLFRNEWTHSTRSLGLQYGVPISNPEPGPRWRVEATEHDGAHTNAFYALPSSFAGVHDRLSEILAGLGRRYIHSYVFTMMEPEAGVEVSRMFYY